MQETWVQSLAWKDPLEKEKATPVFWPGEFCNCGLPYSSDGKEFACNAGDGSLIPGSGRSPGEGNGNPLQYSWLENPMDRGLRGYSPWGDKESDTTKWLTHTHTHPQWGPTGKVTFSDSVSIMWCPRLVTLLARQLKHGTSHHYSASPFGRICKSSLLALSIPVVLRAVIEVNEACCCYISDSLKEEADRWRRNK